MKKIFPESSFAHHWLDGLSGLEIGPSTHNPFGLNTRTVGLGGDGYTQEQLSLTGEVSKIDVLAEAGAIPLYTESEEFILASHVIEHCPDFIKTVLEWYRIVKVEGYLLIVVPHRDSAPSDRGKPLTSWNHLVKDYMTHVTPESEPEGENFLYCHYHVFSPNSFKDFMSRIFGNRLTLVSEQDPDDKVGNGFSLVYKKTKNLRESFPWSFQGDGLQVHVQRPADYYQLRELEYKPAQGIERKEKIMNERSKALSSTSQKHQKIFGDGIVVSAIVPAYNSERFMRGVLEDLERQTIATQLEIIIIETGSETREIEIIQEFQRQYDNIVYLRTSERMNATAATNLGVKLARGTFLTIAATDDRLRGDALETMAREHEKHPEVGVVYADVFMTQFENQTFQRFIRGGYSIRFDFSPEMMLTGYHMGPLVMWKRKIHDSVGFFNDSFLCASDYEFWCRVARHYPMLHIPEFLGLYLQNPNGTVNLNPEVSQGEFRKIIEANRSHYPPPVRVPLPILQYEKPVCPNKYVNIGMVTYNRLDFTKSALSALINHTYFPHVISVVDNGSTDGTREYLQGLQRQGFITNLILLPENVGVAKASNLAWSLEPDAEYYLKLDNDIVIQKCHWLSELVEVIDHISELGAVAYNFEPVSYHTTGIQGLRIRPKLGTLGGACILIPQRTHQKFGFWCEDYGFYGEEDADYAIRLRLAGLQLAYMEDEKIGVHLPAGRAAHIDENTLKATDGVEEETHAEYRAFKDECRRKNVQEIAKKNWDDYQKGLKPLYCSSSFVQEFQDNQKTSVRSDRHSSTKDRVIEQRDLSSIVNQDTPDQKTVGEVSVILTDPICGRIRLLQPLMAGIERWKQGLIAVDGKVLSGDSPLPVGLGQTWVFQRTCLLDETYLNQVRAQGTRLVHDCDDLLWKIPAENPNHFVMTPQVIEKMFRLMKLADCVTVSTEPIQIDLQKKGIATQVIPNSLVRQEWETLIPQRRAGSRPRVGWAGQAKVHKGDTAILETIIEELKEEVEWVFLGDAPRTARSPGVISETFSMVDLLQYPRKLASLNLDLALAPLVPNHFNEAKSDIRILQYGILGYPVIGTDIFPHQHAPILRLPHEPQAWIKAIRERIHELDELGREGDNLKHWVLGNRLMEHVLPEYDRIWVGHEAGGRAGEARRQIHTTPTPAFTPQLTSHFDCSIIIPVFNKGELTQQCLTHLAEVTDGCSFEVIVVDNASTDGTKAFLSTLKGDIQVVSNEQNYGFAKACNQGAEAAKGRYLVFLNNDTIPKRGWLTALVEEVQQHPNVAIAGSKLLYPDETIQHAGVVFSKNCLTPYHLFRGAPGDLKAANARREFQVVTAACMLIRREEFEAVGGFDEVYQNGFEDVDLCLKVGKRGKQIIYQPRSVLYHLEHQTPGRKDPEAERHNGKVLMERWGSSIVIDEDLYTVPEGYANRYYFQDGWLRQLLEPFRDEAERVQWERVRCVQDLLRRKQKQSGQLTRIEESRIGTLMAEVMEWPQDVEVLRWGAVVCRSLNLPEWEVKFWERVLALGEDLEAREGLIKALLAQGSFENASWHIHAILSKETDHPAGNFLNGILLMQRQQYAEAIPCFQKAVAAGADPGKARRGLGMAYLGAGQMASAWETFKLVLQGSPDDQEVLQHLLQTGTALGHWKDLAGILENYLERNPADCDMRFALAAVQYREGLVSQSQHHCTILATLKPDFEGLHDLQERLDHSCQQNYALAK